MITFNWLKQYSRYEVIFVLLSALAGMAIFLGDTTLISNVRFYGTIRVVLTYALTAYSLLYLIKRPITNQMLLYFAIILLWWGISFFHVAPNAPLQPNVLAVLLLVMYGFLNSEERINIYRLYRKYIIVMCFCGILAYMFFLLNIQFPHSIVPYYGSKASHQFTFYYNYYISFILVNSYSLRLCGWFNEPGYLGTIGAIILVIENVNLKKIGNVIILIACIFTFSLASVIIIITYLALVSIKKRKMIFVLLGFILAGMFILPVVFEGDKNFENLTERLEVEDGNLKGDNRTNNSEFKQLQKVQFENLDKAMFGYGTGALLTYGNMGIAGIKVEIYKYGIIGILLTYGLLFVYALKYSRRNYQAMCFVICFFLSAYQRPYIFSADYLLLLFGGISYILSMTKKRQESLETA